MKKQLLLLCCLLSFSISQSQTFNDGVLEYTVISGTDVSVKKYNYICPTGSITIPNTVIDNGTTYTITSIHSSAFSNCNNLTSIDIPNSVTNIESKAFMYCSNLTNVTIGNSVNSIGASAFRDCSSLTSINIPNSVNSIGNQTFYACSALTSVTISNSVIDISDSLNVDHHQLRAMPPYDEYGRPNTLYQLPYLDFSLEVISEITTETSNTTTSENTDNIVQKRARTKRK